jgi:large subunit ribosomal protein L31
MKKDTHPTMHPVIYRDSNAKKDFYAYSTRVSDEKETIDGVEYFIFRVDVSSASHPFFTGKQTLIDTSGRVDKFKAKMEKAKLAKK